MDGNTIGIIVGCVGGGLLVLSIVVTVSVCCYLKRKRQQTTIEILGLYLCLILFESFSNFNRII